MWSGSGDFCAGLALFEDTTRKIWSQADLDVNFLAPNRLNASRFLTIDAQDEFAELSFSGGAGAFGRHPLSTRTSGPLNLWFVDRIVSGLFDSFGLGWIDQNGVVISDDVIDFNSGIGRTDTVAHEIGHNLGLTHSNFGAGPATNLMSDGGVRNVPSTLGDITPDGARLSRLTDSQIDFARDSSLVTSSPGPSSGTGPTPSTLNPPAFLDAVPAASTADTAIAPSAPIPAQSIPTRAQEATPQPSSSLIPLAESEPLLRQMTETEVMIAALPRDSQQIPNGPAMSVFSAGVLAAFFWYHRSQR